MMFRTHINRPLLSRPSSIEDDEDSSSRSSGGIPNSSIIGGFSLFPTVPEPASILFLKLNRHF